MKTNPIYTIANSGLKLPVNKVLYLNENVYSLTINPSISGTASADANIGTQNYQTNLYATPMQGKILSGWNVTGGTVTNNIFTFGNSDAIVEPVFEEYIIEEVTIGPQTWMAKNLAIDDGGEGIRIEHITYTLNGETFNWGTQYFYTQAAAIRIANSTTAEGWHLPSTAEFVYLTNYALGSKKLKSITGWQYSNPGGNGTDDYGFTMLPVGQYSNSTASNNRLGQNSCYWTTTNGVNYWATWSNNNFTTGESNTGTFNPVRLIKD